MSTEERIRIWRGCPSATSRIGFCCKDRNRTGEAGRIHHQPVEALIDGAVDAVDRFAFDVGVEDVQMIAMIPRMALQHGVEFGRGGRAVDRRLPPAEKGEIGALQQEDLRHRGIPCSTLVETCAA
jgi:hypothetical protein